jgi:PAS domain S-box-containing protein
MATQTPQHGSATATIPTITNAAATALVTRDALLAQAVQASADAVFCQDISGTIITWNPAAERIYGYTADEILGKRADDLLPDRTRDELLAAHRTALSGVQVERFDSWHQRSDGTLVPVNVSASPLRDPHGQVIAVATTVADISERMRLAKALERAGAKLQRQNAALTRSNRDLEQFAYVASHDLSEPLRVMTGYVDQIERRYDAVLDDRGRRYMQHIVEASVRMRALIDDLLDYSRFLRAPEASSLIDTGAVVDRVLKALDASIREADAVVVVSPLPAVWSDTTHLESLVTNLISNAVKFRSPERAARVEIAGTQDGEWVTLTVDDSGIGVDPEYRDRVFRMFQRLHDREAYAGTGIGLAIAQQIVELHNGRIWIENSALGGARFCCTLPTIAQEQSHDD